MVPNTVTGNSYTMTAANGVNHPSLLTYKTYVTFQNLRSKVECFVGDHILGTNVLRRFNHDIHPGRNLKRNWCTATARPLEANHA